MSDWKIVGADRRGNLPTRVMGRLRELFGNAKEEADRAQAFANDAADSYNGTVAYATQTLELLDANGSAYLDEMGDVRTEVVQVGDAVGSALPIFEGLAEEMNARAAEARANVQQTGADRTATGQDRTATSEDRQSARLSSEAAANSLAQMTWTAIIPADANLDSYGSTGRFHQPQSSAVSTERNYPKNTVVGFLEVRLGTGGIVIQEYSAHGGVVGFLDGGFWRRRRLNAGGAWSAWKFYPAMRWDTAAGRALYAMNPDNNAEQLIYGDTGMRRVNEWRAAGWTGDLYVRRLGNQVYIECGMNHEQTQPANTTLVIVPTGFKATRSINKTIVGGTVTHGLVLDATTGVVRADSGLNALRWAFNYTTNDPWPTTNPGVAA